MLKYCVETDLAGLNTALVCMMPTLLKPSLETAVVGGGRSGRGPRAVWTILVFNPTTTTSLKKKSFSLSTSLGSQAIAMLK